MCSQSALNPEPRWADRLSTGALTMCPLHKTHLDQSLINSQPLFHFLSDLERLKELSWQVRNPRRYPSFCIASRGEWCLVDAQPTQNKTVILIHRVFFCIVQRHNYSVCLFFSDSSKVRLEHRRFWNRLRATLAADGESEWLRRAPSHLQWPRNLQHSGKRRRGCCNAVAKNSWHGSATVGQEVQQSLEGKTRITKG